MPLQKELDTFSQQKDDLLLKYKETKLEIKEFEVVCKNIEEMTREKPKRCFTRNLKEELKYQTK